MTNKDKIDLLNKYRDLKPLPIDKEYLSKLASISMRGEVISPIHSLDIFAEVCAVLSSWGEENNRSYITFEEYVEYFNSEKAFDSHGRDISTTSEYYFSLNLFRTCAFMIYVTHEFYDKQNDVMKEITEKEENTGGNA